MLPIRRFNEQGLFPSVFNDFFNNDWLVKANATAPSVNILENEQEYQIEVAAPGADKNDFNVHLNRRDELVVKLEKKTENEDKKGQKYLHREFSYTRFEQSFTLADNVDKDQIRADVNNGILTVTLPKITAEAKPKECRTIEIS